MDYRVLFVTKKDINQCKDIYNFYVSSYFLEERELFPSEFKEKFNNIIKAYPFIVIKDIDDKVLGLAYLDKYDLDNLTTQLFIYIHHDYLNNNYEEVLLDNILKLSKQYDINKIITILNKDNNYLVNLYQKYGFKEIDNKLVYVIKE